jgi:Putative adhesin
MRTVRFMAVALFAVATVCSPALAANDTEVFDRTIPLLAGGTFTLTNVEGSIAVEGWDRQAIEIHAVKTARQSAADLALVRIDADSGPGGVTVSTVYPQNQDQDVEVSVDYTVRVPRHALLAQLATVNGSLRVSGVEGQGQLLSVNGDIDVVGSAGGFSARTTNGEVHVQLLRLGVPGAIALETVNGSVALALPRNAAATLDARSLNGDFHSDLPMSLLSAYSPRGVRGRLGRGGVPIRLRTVNGAIRVVTLPQGV